MRKTYPSATVEDLRSGTRYEFARVELYDDRLEAYDKASGALLLTIAAPQGEEPGSSRDWLRYGDAGRVREHCGGCTARKATRVVTP